MNEDQPDHTREIKELQRKLQLHAKKQEVEITAAKKTIREVLGFHIGESLRLDTSTDSG
jgi:flagellar motor switch protein FliM